MNDLRDIFYSYVAVGCLTSNTLVLLVWGRSRTRSKGGLLILDKGDVEVYGPNSEKRVLHRIKQKIYMLPDGYFEPTPKKTSVSVTLNTRQVEVFN